MDNEETCGKLENAVPEKTQKLPGRFLVPPTYWMTSDQAKRVCILAAVCTANLGSTSTWGMDKEKRPIFTKLKDTPHQLLTSEQTQRTSEQTTTHNNQQQSIACWYIYIYIYIYMYIYIYIYTYTYIFIVLSLPFVPIPHSHHPPHLCLLTVAWAFDSIAWHDTHTHTTIQHTRIPSMIYT